MAEEIKQYFTSYRSPGWNAPVETVPQEVVAQPEINPNGWVINSSANVFIDEEGLHIFDGALFLSDLSGESILGPSGFSGSWQQYLSSGGVYNSQFSAGVIGALVVNEVGTGNTTADYEASNAAQLPYWIISVDTYSALSLVADTTAPSGKALQIDLSVMPDIESQKAYFYQDVPITAGRIYLATVHMRTVNWAYPSDAHVQLYASWRDKDHGLIGSGGSISSYGFYTEGLPGTYEPYSLQIRTVSISGVPDKAPPNAAFVRIKIGVSSNAALGSAGLIRFGMIEVKEESPIFGGLRFHNHTTWDDQIGILYLYNDENTLAFRTVYRPSPTVSMTDTADGGKIIFSDGKLPLTGRNVILSRNETANIPFLNINQTLRRLGEAWVSATLINSWVAYGAIDWSNYGTLQYRKDAQGYVHLRGLIKDGSSISAAMTTLPVGFRPGILMLFPSLSVDTASRIDIDTLGVVKCAGLPGNTPGWVSLNGISFYAEG